MTELEAHAGPLPAGTQTAAALVASEKTLHVALAHSPTVIPPRYSALVDPAGNLRIGGERPS